MTFGDSFPLLSGHTAILNEERDLIYVFGGYDGTEVYNDVWIFDIKTSSWSKL